MPVAMVQLNQRWLAPFIREQRSGVRLRGRAVVLAVEEAIADKVLSTLRTPQTDESVGDGREANR